MTDLQIAPGGSASVYVLHEGYVGRDGDDERVAGTVTRDIPPRTSPRWRPHPEDVCACPHAWWGADGPAEDPLGSDAAALHVSRARLLSFASVIVPGYGAAFRPDRSTPR